MTKHGHGKTRRALGAIIATGALVTFMAITALPASAVITCEVTGDSPNQTMTVTLMDADTITVVVNGANIEYNATACDPVATTAGVSAIVVNAHLLTESEDQTVTFDDSGGPFTASITVSLGAGDDTFTGDISEDIEIDGGPGNNTITTGSGDDTIRTGSGNDTITAGAGRDVVRSGGGSDTVSGGNGNDSLFGGPGSDTLSGEGGRDVLWGNGGDDTLSGGVGSDWIAPGAGNDSVDGGAQRDVVSFVDATARVDVDLRAGTSSTGPDDDTLTSIENVHGSAYVDTIRGTGGNNRLLGKGRGDLLIGRGGSDTLRGGDGPDTIRGGRGNDRLFGQRGNDLLNGGPGTDRCKGGPGNDVIRKCES